VGAAAALLGAEIDGTTPAGAAVDTHRVVLLELIEGLQTVPTTLKLDDYDRPAVAGMAAGGAPGGIAYHASHLTKISALATAVLDRSMLDIVPASG